ncbi:hypothetical protein LNQ49_00940 [Flavobacterium sp. F-65]|jgi:hypothetical protein|uniref:Uncharacterized protein n=1 Tax=Flavobacterium pisciphilum TaxID=2893755 RepID=A0ABS8MN30_9FLAO|nr:hypothetical protein [Flavobacterium sp. F-65]MCC9070171.1 hypothetical protein [Flavobacterium sp. F-65]
MKYIAILLLAFIIENSTVIKLEDYYNGEGVIFDKSIKYPFVEPNYKKGYTPTMDDIKKTETHLLNNYYEYEANVLDSFNIDKSKFNVKFKKPLNVKKKFLKYNRQYAGFIDKSNDTIIYIGLLNFKNKKLANKYFEGWKENIFFGFDGFYEKNQKTYLYNLSKNKFIYKLGYIISTKRI